MTKPVLHGLFNIDKTHRLEIDPETHDPHDLPYHRLYFVEKDSGGSPVARIRYWEAFGGDLYGAEYLDLEGNVLLRAVESHRATTKHRAA